MGKSGKISIYMYLKKITHNTHTIVSYSFCKCQLTSNNKPTEGLKTANDRLDFKMEGFRHWWWKKCLQPWDPDGISHFETLGFFAFSLQIPIVYSAARGRAKIIVV